MCKKQSAKHDTELDPTSAAPLQQLKQQVLAASSVQYFLKDLNGGQLSLVLSGGGGKGAYEAGVVLALFDCGIDHFSALSGTSVGALNAAICHEVFRLKDRELVTRIWGQLSVSRVLRPSWMMLIKLAQVIQHGVVAGGPFVVPTDLPAKLRASLKLTTDDAPRGPRAVIREIVDHARHEALGAAPRVLGVLLLFVLLYVLIVTKVQIPLRVLYFCTLFLVSIPLIVSIIGLTLKRLPSVFSNAPLRRTINLIDLQALRTSETPIVCTFALFLPTKSKWFDEGTLLHDYKALNQMKSNDEVMKSLLQTAALPEIFPPRTVDGLWCIDGGLVDNTPILPGIIFGSSLGDRNTLIIVYLDPTLGSRANLLEDERLRVRKLARRWEYLQNKVDHTFSDLVDQRFTQCRFIPIIPSAGLGNLITGTMNFTTKKASRLIAMGYRDTLLTIQRVSDQVVS